MTFLTRVNASYRISAAIGDGEMSESRHFLFFHYKGKVYIDWDNKDVSGSFKPTTIDPPDEGDFDEDVLDVTSVFPLEKVKQWLPKELELRPFDVSYSFDGQQGARDSHSDPGFEPEAQIKTIDVYPTNTSQHRLDGKGLLKNKEFVEYLADRAKDYVGYYNPRRGIKHGGQDPERGDDRD